MLKWAWQLHICRQTLNILSLVFGIITPLQMLSTWLEHIFWISLGFSLMFSPCLLVLPWPRPMFLIFWFCGLNKIVKNLWNFYVDRWAQKQGGYLLALWQISNIRTRIAWSWWPKKKSTQNRVTQFLDVLLGFGQSDNKKSPSHWAHLSCQIFSDFVQFYWSCKMKNIEKHRPSLWHY